MTRRLSVTLGVATMLLGCIPDRLGAQEPPSSFWIQAGLGVGTLPGASGVSAEAQLAGQRGRHVLSVRGSLVTDLSDGLFDLGVLYGRAWSRTPGIVTASAGIGLVDVDLDPPDGSRASVYTVGAPVVISALLRAGGVVGLGIQGSANLNPERSFAAVMAVVQLGVLR